MHSKFTTWTIRQQYIQISTQQTSTTNQLTTTKNDHITLPQWETVTKEFTRSSHQSGETLELQNIELLSLFSPLLLHHQHTLISSKWRNLEATEDDDVETIKDITFIVEKSVNEQFGGFIIVSSEENNGNGVGLKPIVTPASEGCGGGCGGCGGGCH